MGYVEINITKLRQVIAVFKVQTYQRFLEEKQFTKRSQKFFFFFFFFYSSMKMYVMISNKI